jgi:hypothetical protein
MIGRSRLRRFGLLLGAVVVLVGVAAGVRAPGAADHPGGRAGPAVTATGLLGSGTSGATDTRLQRDVETGRAQQGSRLDATGSSAVSAPASRRSTAALAAVLERAGHPERFGHFLLRGPPGPSA